MSDLTKVVSLKDAEAKYTPKWFALDRVESLMVDDETLQGQDAVLKLIELETEAYLRGSNDKEQFGAVLDVGIMLGVDQASAHKAVERAAERLMTIEYGDGSADN